MRACLHILRISDRKLAQGGGGNQVSYFEVQKIAAADYYPYGQLHPGRYVDLRYYRYGYNGKEREERGEFGSLMHYFYRYCIYNPALGRFISVDPLVSKFPWNSPYAFSENNSIAYVEFEGLERYFAADGRYLGQLGTSNEMRVIEEERVKAFSSFYRTHRKDIRPPLFEGSVPFHSAEERAQINITQSIYSAVINKGERLESVRVRLEDEGTGMSVTKGTKRLTIYPMLTKHGEYVLDDYYNFINLLYHEEQHIRGIPDDGWSHFEIGIKQTQHWSFKKMNEAGKAYVRDVMRGYLRKEIERWMDTQLFYAKNQQEALNRYYSSRFQRGYRKYKTYVRYFNNTFNENIPIKDYLEFINKRKYK